MIIRSLTPNDVKDFYEFQKENFIDFWSENQIDSSLKNPNFHSLIFFDGGEIIAALCYTRVLDESEIELVLTKKTLRRQGLGTKIVAKGLADLTEQGATKVFLEVRAGNEPAKKLYKKFGFKPYGTRKNYYKDGEDAILMSF